MSRAAVRRRRCLFGFLAGLVIGASVTPPMTLVPGTGELIWLLLFAIPVGVIAASFPVESDTGNPTRGLDA